MLVAATFTLIVNLFQPIPYQWLEGASIYFAVLFIAAFTASQEFIQEKQFLKLHDAIRNEEVNVIRGQYGLSMTQKVNKVVVGDIVLIETGMRIPADCILIDGIDITVDESLYHEGRETIIRKQVGTGDNHRENPDPFLLSRSLVMSGKGKAVVCCVGKYTQLARQPELEAFGNEEKMTPL